MFPNWSRGQHKVSSKVSHSQQFYLDPDQFDGSGDFFFEKKNGESFVGYEMTS